MIKKALTTLRLRPDDAVYAGDAPVDIKASRNAGVASVAIARERVLGDRLRAEEPDYLFDGLA